MLWAITRFLDSPRLRLGRVFLLTKGRLLAALSCLLITAVWLWPAHLDPGWSGNARVWGPHQAAQATGAGTGEGFHALAVIDLEHLMAFHPLADDIEFMNYRLENSVRDFKREQQQLEFALNQARKQHATHQEQMEQVYERLWDRHQRAIEREMRALRKELIRERDRIIARYQGIYRGWKELFEERLQEELNGLDGEHEQRLKGERDSLQEEFYPRIFNIKIRLLVPGLDADVRESLEEELDDLRAEYERSLEEKKVELSAERDAFEARRRGENEETLEGYRRELEMLADREVRSRVEYVRGRVEHMIAERDRNIEQELEKEWLRLITRSQEAIQAMQERVIIRSGARIRDLQQEIVELSREIERLQDEAAAAIEKKAAVMAAEHGLRIVSTSPDQMSGAVDLTPDLREALRGY